jgi:hypothetical protein
MLPWMKKVNALAALHCHGESTNSAATVPRVVPIAAMLACCNFSVMTALAERKPPACAASLRRVSGSSELAKATK